MSEASVIASLLHSAHTIAVVGLSNKPWRASYGVSEYMRRAGYRIIPVNPELAEVLGELTEDVAIDPGAGPVGLYAERRGLAAGLRVAGCSERCGSEKLPG